MGILQLRFALEPAPGAFSAENSGLDESCYLGFLFAAPIVAAIPSECSFGPISRRLGFRMDLRHLLRTSLYLATLRLTSSPALAVNIDSSRRALS